MKNEDTLVKTNRRYILTFVRRKLRQGPNKVTRIIGGQGRYTGTYRYKVRKDIYLS